MPLPGGGIAARPAGTADLPLLRALTDAAYEGYVPALGGKPLPMLDDHAARVDAGQAWVVERDGRPVGCAILWPEADHLWLDSLVVDPAAQGGGIGQWLLAWADDRARALGLPELRLLTHERMTRNIAIYARAGFAEIERRRNPKRADWIAVFMRRAVA